MFEPRGSFTVSGELALSTNGMDPEIKVWLPGTRLQRIVRWDTPDRTVRSGDVVAYRRRLFSLGRSFVDGVPVAEVFPAVRELKTDPVGNVWVRRYPRPTQDKGSWLKFDDRGAFLCELG